MDKNKAPAAFAAGACFYRDRRSVDGNADSFISPGKSARRLRSRQLAAATCARLAALSNIRNDRMPGGEPSPSLLAQNALQITKADGSMRDFALTLGLPAGKIGPNRLKLREIDKQGRP